MQSNEKNLKDITNGHSQIMSELPPNRSFSFPFGSYNKVNKLITALYMVTDILDKEEPIRLKLRTLGVEILSDTKSVLKDNNNDLEDKISIILSFLNIASNMNMISEMNINILRKEFADLKQSISEYKKQNNLWLEDFIHRASVSDGGDSYMSDTTFPIGHKIEFIKKGQSTQNFNKGQNTSIGVQRGSTLLKALSKVDKVAKDKPYPHINKDNFTILKNKRREEIIAIIKEKKDTENADGLTITDIKNSTKGLLVSCGDKTLQRELTSMIKDNVLYKKGEKRWSKYNLV